MTSHTDSRNETTTRGMRTTRAQFGVPQVASAVALIALGLFAPSAGASSVLSAGLNQYGQVGDGNMGTSFVPAANSAFSFLQPIGMSSGTTVVSAGGAHSLAVKNGGLYGWGLTLYGALGDGAGDGRTITSNPIPHAGVGLTSGITDLKAGLYHSMALANGAVYTWGLNTDGQVSNGNSASTGAASTPAIVPTLSSGVTAIASGGRHVLAIQNGALYAWGSTLYGQVGTGQKATSPIQSQQPPGIQAPVLVTGMGSGVTQVAAGSFHSIAVMNNTVYTFGSNQYGQLGINGTTGTDTYDSFYPTAQAVTGLPSGTVTDISGGNSFSLALVNGNIYAWGRNENGQLGQADGQYENSPVPKQVQGITGSTIIDVEAGSTSSYALAADGSLWDWGNNTYGQLGLGTTNTPYDAPQHILPPTGYQYTTVGSGPVASNVLVLLTQVGDFNRDDVVDAADIDLLFTATQGAVSAANARYDVTINGTVVTGIGAAGSDADYFVKTLKHTAYGDSNFDGKVNFDDLLALAKSYGATTGGWANGNFDGVAGVNFNDLLLLAKNYGFVGTGAAFASLDFTTDWKFAQSLVPEPTSIAMLAGLSGLVVRRRRAR